MRMLIQTLRGQSSALRQCNYYYNHYSFSLGCPLDVFKYRFTTFHSHRCSKVKLYTEKSQLFGITKFEGRMRTYSDQFQSECPDGYFLTEYSFPTARNQGYTAVLRGLEVRLLLAGLLRQCSIPSLRHVTGLGQSLRCSPRTSKMDVQFKQSGHVAITAPFPPHLKGQSCCSAWQKSVLFPAKVGHRRTNSPRTILGIGLWGMVCGSHLRCMSYYSIKYKMLYSNQVAIYFIRYADVFHGSHVDGTDLAFPIS